MARAAEGQPSSEETHTEGSVAKGRDTCNFLSDSSERGDTERVVQVKSKWGKTGNASILSRSDPAALPYDWSHFQIKYSKK